MNENVAYEMYLWSIFPLKWEWILGLMSLMWWSRYLLKLSQVSAFKEPTSSSSLYVIQSIFFLRSFFFQVLPTVRLQLELVFISIIRPNKKLCIFCVLQLQQVNTLRVSPHSLTHDHDSFSGSGSPSLPLFLSLLRQKSRLQRILTHDQIQIYVFD